MLWEMIKSWRTCCSVSGTADAEAVDAVVRGLYVVGYVRCERWQAVTHGKAVVWVGDVVDESRVC